MNLKDFDLLKEEEGFYTIGHPQGKSIRVDKKGLSSKAHELISQLKKHRGYADGGQVDDMSDQDESQVVDEPAAPAATEAPVNPLGDLPQLNEELTYAKPELSDEESPESARSPANQFVTAFRQLQGTPGEQQAQPPAAPAQPAPQPGLTPEQQQKIDDEFQKSYQKMMGQQVPAAQVEEKPLSPLGQEKATLQGALADQQKIARDTGNAMGQTLKAYNAVPTQTQIFKNHQVANQKFQNDYAKLPPLDQNRIFDKNTGSKIQAGIGLMISGIGSGLSGQPNLAMQMIENQINRDLDSQKNDQSKAMNLWKMNRENMGSEMSANLATQNQLMGAVKIQAMQAAARTAGPQAAERIAPLIQAADAKIADNEQNIAMLEGTPDGSEEQYLMQMEQMAKKNPAIAKHMQERYIPGKGVTTRPVSEKQHEAYTDLNALDKNIDRALQFSQEHGKGFGTSRYSSTGELGESIRDALILDVNKLFHIGSLNKEEYHAFSRLIPDPGSIWQESTQNKLKELKSLMDKRLKAMDAGLGARPFTMTPQDMKVRQYVKDHPDKISLKQRIELKQLGVIE